MHNKHSIYIKNTCWVTNGIFGLSYPVADLESWEKGARNMKYKLRLFESIYASLCVPQILSGLNILENFN